MITPLLSPYFAGAFYCVQPSEQDMTLPKEGEETTGYPNRKTDPLSCICFCHTMKNSDELLPREAVNAPSLEFLAFRLDGTFSSLVKQKVSLPMEVFDLHNP